MLDVDPTKVVTKDRLRPGKMLLVDTVKGRVIDDDELKESYAGKRPYGQWLDEYLVELKDLKIPNVRVPRYTGDDLHRIQKAFGYSYESVKTVMLPMAKTGAESTAAWVLIHRWLYYPMIISRCLTNFKQLFHRVTNPPIDAIREEIVTSTTVYVGEDGNILEEEPKNCQVLKIKNPILTNTDLLKIKHMKRKASKLALFRLFIIKTQVWRKPLTACLLRQTVHIVTAQTS